MSVNCTMNRADRRHVAQALQRTRRRVARAQNRRNKMLTGETYDRDVPGEQDQVFTFRHLTALEVDEADLSGSARLGKELEALPKSLVGQVMDKDSETVKDAEERREQQYRGFDPNVLVKHGIVAWTYRDKAGVPVPCDHDHIATMLWRTRNWAARVIFDEDIRDPGEVPDSATNSAGDESPSNWAPRIAASLPE